MTNKVVFVIFYYIVLTYFCITNIAIINWEIMSGLLVFPPILVFPFALFKYLLWKIPFVSKITNVQNLNGTWFGEFEWKNCDNKEVSNMAIGITQDFYGFNITSYTEKSVNNSYNEKFIVNRKNKINQMIYSYSQRGQNIDDRFIYSGCAELEILESENEILLNGIFWTEKMTIGSVKLKRISKKTFFSYEDAEKKFNEKGVK